MPEAVVATARETIENYDEIAAALREGPFAYCLEDEPAYRSEEALVPPVIPQRRVVRASYGDSDRDAWRSVIGSDPRLVLHHLLSRAAVLDRGVDSPRTMHASSSNRC